MMCLTSNKRVRACLGGAAMLVAAGTGHAHEAGDRLAKLRIANVDPDSSSGEVFLNGAAVPGSGVTVNDAPTLDISFAYVFSRHWAVELLLDITSKHDVKATGDALGGLGKIAEVRPLPPSLMLQYHFLPDGKWHPYVGAGVNYTNFVSEDASSSIEGALGGKSDVSLDDSVGLVLQAGIDVDLNNDWFLTADIKWIDLDTDAKISGPDGTVTVEVEIDPLVYGIGVGRRF